MSEQVPEGFPLDPDEVSRILAGMSQMPDNAPDTMAVAIETMSGVQARWYHGWIKAGIPEPLAAGAFVKMIEVMFGKTL